MYVIFLQLIAAIALGVVLRNYVRKGKALQLRTIQYLLRVLISVGTLWSVAHVILLFCGIEEPFYEQLFGFSFFGLVLLILSTYVLELCWVFKVCCVYCYLVSECIILQSGDFFGSSVNLARAVVLAIGGFLIFGLLNSKYCRDYD